MSRVTISGPDYQKYHTTFSYTASITELGQTIVYIKWYKNGVEITAFSGKRILTLYDAEAPAAGKYTCKVQFSNGPVTTTVTSDPITLEMGPDNRDIEVAIKNIEPEVEVSKGESLTLSPTVTTKPNVNTKMTWVKDNKVIATTQKLVLPIKSRDDQGIYTFSVLAQAASGSYNPAIADYKIEVKVALDPYNYDTDIYIHDLNPARNKGFIQVGWWVIDEINSAVKSGIKWNENPDDNKFKYNQYLNTLAKGFIKWPDLEVQGTRDGYILGRAQLIDGKISNKNEYEEETD